MAKKPACAQCGKDAIGIQSFGCRSAYVCRDHACSFLLALRPGQKYSSGDCCFERFGTSGIRSCSPQDDGCSGPADAA